MSELFLQIINMSISASYIVLAVLLLRLLLGKAPKWIAVVLWGIVALRLVCPFSFESVLSLIPSAEVVAPDIMMDPTPEINTGIPIFNQVINPMISRSFAPDPVTSANPLQLWIPTFALIWIVGMIALLIYTVISYVRLKRKIGTAVLLRDNIYQSENVVSPFVLGIIKPKIYLPFSMNEQDMVHVIAHEQAHIRRKDHWWKPLGFLLLTLHWFNPLMWLGYVLLCRDIELACDEKVIGELDRDSRADYSQALLTCSVNKRIIAACPLAFGEVGVKDRVKSVLNYKKPAFWIIIAAIVVCVVVAVCFLTDPINDSIHAKRVDSDTIELNIKYPFGSYGGYSVRYVPEDEGEYIGDGMIDYDGSLGRYRIIIDFGDIEPSEELYDYIIEENGEIKNAPIKMRIKIAHPSDHGFVLYVGFDEKIYIDPVEYTKLNELGGTIKIKIKTNPPELSNEIFTDYDGVYVSVSSIETFEDMHKLFAFVWHNDTEKIVTYGLAYSIEYKEGDKWTDVFVDADDLISIYFPVSSTLLPAFLLQPHSTANQSFSTQRFDISKSGTYRLKMPFWVDGSEETYYTWIEFKVDAESDTTTGSNSLREAFLRGQYPEYFALDASNGLDVYVAAFAKDYYICKVFPHLDERRTLVELNATQGFSVEDIRAILSTYKIDYDDVYVIPWQDPLSSYIGAWQIGTDGEDLDAKKRAHADNLRRLLLGIGEVSIN